jgi:PEP-CTERM motif
MSTLKRFLALLPLLTLAGIAHAQTYLLVPDSGNDRILALDPNTGAIINANFITDLNLTTPIQAIDSGRGTIFVSDQVVNSVREYSYNGAFMGTVVGSAQGISNLRGIAVRGGSLYISVGGGTLAGTVQRYDLTTSTLSTFATLPTASASPWNILFRTSDVLITDSTSDDIERFDLAGTYQGKYYNSNGSTELNFPQQLVTRSNGNLVVSGFSLPTAIYEYTGVNSGTQVATYAPGLGVRGVWELGNGELIYSAGTRLERINTTTNTTTSILNQVGASFRHFSIVTLSSSAPEPGTMGLLALGVAGLALARRRRDS